MGLGRRDCDQQFSQTELKICHFFLFRVVQHHIDVADTTIQRRQATSESEFDVVDTESSDIDDDDFVGDATDVVAAADDVDDVVQDVVPVVVDAAIEDRGKNSGPWHVQELCQLWNPTDASGSGLGLMLRVAIYMIADN